MMGTLFKFTLAAMVVFLAGAPARADEARPKYVVIVNKGVKASAVDKSNLRAMYLKKDTRWDDDAIVVPFDLTSSDPVRAVFSEAVHGKNAQAVVAEWRQRLFTGQGTPPHELKTDEAMIEKVASTPGALGYVRATTTLPATVKVLAIAE